MRLLITTPATVVVDEPDVSSVRAEDESGSFGILDGHDDLLTALTVSVVVWHRLGEGPGYCAVCRGILTVANGREVSIATREAVMGDDLDRLEQVVLGEFRQRAENERAARATGVELEMKAIRQIVRYLRPERPGAGER